jgi:REP element-mobilizing transposase RayT
VFKDLWLGRIVVSTLRRAQTNGYASTLAFVVMPDHLHWLMQLGLIKELSETVRWVKSRSALAVNQQRDSSAPVWQRGFFDNAIRREADLVALSRYIVANPLRARLVESVGDYPHWDAVWMV